MSIYHENGGPILAEDFRYPAEDSEGGTPPESVEILMLEDVLGRLVDDSPAEVIGQRFVVLAYLLQIPGAPRSQRRLASKLGVSVGKVNGIFQRIRKEIRMELRDFYQNPERSAHR